MKIELNKVYRSRGGEQFKVICLADEGKTVVITNKEQNKLSYLSKEGTYFFGPPRQEHENDLIELIGDDFINEKNLRELKFEAYLWEGYYNPDTDFSLDRATGNFCSRLHPSRSLLPASSQGLISKWEVVMKELPID